MLFKEQDGAQAASQIQAFEDTWRWDEGAARAYEECVEAGGKLSETLQAFRKLVGESDMLSEIRPRFLHLRGPRVQDFVHGGEYKPAPPENVHFQIGRQRDH